MDGPNAGGSNFQWLGLRLSDGKEWSLNLVLGDTLSGVKILN